ncbi:hypothetical protein A9Q99_03325 [Gammaproteobacteria bacterium 45_16_T64]|nr:hypothetical protein A9Q99_03325 [Gammaproteobacteria bacterium 45_16_T64]
MSKSVQFYLLGKKGFSVLKDFIYTYGAENITLVIGSRDKGVKNDYFEKTQSICNEHNISFLERHSPLPATQVDISFAIGWRWIIDQPCQLIIFHDSILPKFRGFSPLVNMLIQGEPRIGVTALHASAEYDAGDIIAQASVNIIYPIKISNAIDKIAPLYSELLNTIYASILKDKELPAKKQISTDASYSLWRNEQDYLIDWSDSSVSILRFCDAVGYPFRGAKTYIDDIIYRIFDVETVEDVNVENREKHIGKVIFIKNECPIVVCGEGLLKITHFSTEHSLENMAKINFRSRFSDRIS